MFCSQCGSEISDNSKFCYQCGARITENQNDANKFVSSVENNDSSYYGDKYTNSSISTYEISRTINDDEENNIAHNDKEVRELFREKQDDYLRQNNYQLMRNRDDYHNNIGATHKKKGRPEQTTAKMTFSILAIIFIIIGLNCPSFGGYTFKKMEGRTRLVKTSLTTIGYVNDFFGESSDSGEQDVYQKAKKTLTAIMILKVIIAISIVLLLVNLFIPIKTGLLLLGTIGIIATIACASLFTGMMETMNPDEQYSSILSIVLIIGFILEALSDPGRQNISPKKVQRDF